MMISVNKFPKVLLLADLLMLIYMEIRQESEEI